MAGEVRMQRTIARPAEVSGFGFFGGLDVTLRFLPAGADHGIAFQRVDLTGTPPVAAVIDNAIDLPRRTAIEADGIRVEMIEHVMAALAGLQIDNCLVRLDTPEPPGSDGSCREFCEALLDAGLVEQDQPARVLAVRHAVTRTSADVQSDIRSRPHARRVEAITYQLDYGTRSPIKPQSLSFELDAAAFVNEIAFARTFVLDDEVASLRRMGFGRRVTSGDILVFNRDGVIDNQMRVPDECVRHKILDCIGDLALLGHRVDGHFTAWRSGHRLNREMVRELRRTHCDQSAGPKRNVA